MKYAIALLIAMWLLVADAGATSIVLITTKQGIVIGADGKVVNTHPNSQFSLSPASTKMKIVIVGGRVAVAQCGVESIGNSTTTPYSFDSVVEYLQSNISPQTGVIDTVELVKRRLSQVFDGFDVVLKSGALKRDALPPPGDTFLLFYIAGYENGRPMVYSVRLDIDWTTLHMKAPIESVVAPVPGRKNISLTWTGGPEHGIIELTRGIHTDKTEIAASKIHAEIAALHNDIDIPLCRSLAMARVLLDLEVSSNPDSVGYPLTIFTISQGGIDKYSYANADH